MVYNNLQLPARGFTLIELLLVLTILGVIAALSVSGFIANSVAQQFAGAVTETALTIQEARQRTLSAETETQFGVEISAGAITVFEGDSLVAATAIRSVVDGSAQGVVYEPALALGTTTIVFARLTGEPSATGTIVVRSIRTGATSTIRITDGGLVQY